MSKESVSVYFGTMTGNAEELATRTRDAIADLGIKVTMEDLAKVPAARIAGDGEAVFVISTWGDGEPPDEAEEFYYAVVDGKAGSIENLRYAVVALGDSSYDDFCGCGRKLDEALEKQGAQRVLSRVDLDIDYDEGFEGWLERYLAYLQDR
ncbi:MAG: flavodoxin domain-containing protein [Opitutales bacterium]|nr:flavodoxin domain-containing protein [Opitutales bacterium]